MSFCARSLGRRGVFRRCCGGAMGGVAATPCRFGRYWATPASAGMESRGGEPTQPGARPRKTRGIPCERRGCQRVRVAHAPEAPPRRSISLDGKRDTGAPAPQTTGPAEHWLLYVVIPGPSEARSPESIIAIVSSTTLSVENLTFRGYGFRARGLRPRPGMTGMLLYERLKRQ
jgi:hypothetical protein